MVDDPRDDVRKRAQKIVDDARTKGLEAKVRDNYAYGNVTAFSGLEYVKSDWRAVPFGFEAEAMVHPLLEVREAGSEKAIPVASKEVLAQADPNTNTVLYPQPNKPDPEVVELLENDKVTNREVEPVGDTADATVMEQKLEHGKAMKAAGELDVPAAETEDKASARKLPRKK